MRGKKMDLLAVGRQQRGARSPFLPTLQCQADKSSRIKFHDAHKTDERDGSAERQRSVSSVAGESAVMDEYDDDSRCGRQQQLKPLLISACFNVKIVVKTVFTTLAEGDEHGPRKAAETLGIQVVRRTTPARPGREMVVA